MIPSSAFPRAVGMVWLRNRFISLMRTSHPLVFSSSGFSCPLVNMGPIGDLCRGGEGLIPDSKISFVMPVYAVHMIIKSIPSKTNSGTNWEEN